MRRASHRKVRRVRHVRRARVVHDDDSDDIHGDRRRAAVVTDAQLLACRGKKLHAVHGMLRGRRRIAVIVGNQIITPGLEPRKGHAIGSGACLHVKPAATYNIWQQ